MNLQFPFYKFAFRFDTERLLAEVGAIPETAWRFHHENFKGNSAPPPCDGTSSSVWGR